MLYGIYHSGCGIRNVSEFIVNVYIVNYLDAWPINPPNNFKFKNCLFGGNNRVTKNSRVKNSDKEKYAHSG